MKHTDCCMTGTILKLKSCKKKKKTLANILILMYTLLHSGPLDIDMNISVGLYEKYNLKQYNLKSYIVSFLIRK